MANSRVHLEAERWIVAEFLPRKFDGLLFSPRMLRLTWGGNFDFDAVSSDGEIVGLVSTSAAITATGNNAIGKIHKIKCDALYLLHVVGAKRRIMIFAEDSMLKFFSKEQKSGRFPPELELLHAPLPSDLYSRLLMARAVASAETSPAKEHT